MENRKGTIGKDGRLSLPRDQQHRWGFVPGAEVSFQETDRGLLLRRADPALHKVYVEPTAACNLNCRICMRKVWSEPGGFMEMPTYRRLVAGLQAVPTLTKVAFWGFGEPLLHPDIVEMVALAKGLGAETELNSRNCAPRCCASSSLPAPSAAATWPSPTKRIVTGTRSRCVATACGHAGSSNARDPARQRDGEQSQKTIVRCSDANCQVRPGDLYSTL